MPAGMEGVNRRRRFLQPKEGTQLPGYTGYCPQYKFLIGLTYGNVSANMLKGVKHNPPTTSDPQQAAGPRLLHLPRFDGTRRLTEGMVPGYTGYIPRQRYKDAGTYGRDSAISIDEFFQDTEGAVRANRALRATIAQSPRMSPTASHKEALEKMNSFMPRNATFLEDKRSFLEPPMPGWTGYVPRKKITEVGLGRRYHVVAKNGFGEQKDHMDRHSSLRDTPVTLERSESLSEEEEAGMTDRRLYRPEGMVPKYTGYIPQRRYEFGNTYGATSRSLPVCYHDKPTFGAYLRTQSLQVST